MSEASRNVASLGIRLKPIIQGFFSEVVDTPDAVVVNIYVVDFKDPSKVRFRAPHGLRITVGVADSEIRQAAGNARCLPNGIESWLSSVGGKNRVPVEFVLCEASKLP